MRHSKKGVRFARTPSGNLGLKAMCSTKITAKKMVRVQVAREGYSEKRVAKDRNSERYNRQPGAHTLKLHDVSFGEALASHANAQTHSISCKLRQSTTLEAGKRTGVKTEGNKRKHKLCEEVQLLLRNTMGSSPRSLVSTNATLFTRV